MLYRPFYVCIPEFAYIKSGSLECVGGATHVVDYAMAMTNPAHELRIQQDNQKNIRNICILAHVDHGKEIKSWHY